MILVPRDQVARANQMIRKVEEKVAQGLLPQSYLTDAKERKKILMQTGTYPKGGLK